MITILVGKSASGKDTLMKKMLEEGYSPIISSTTRPMRTGEKNGVEYHFLTDREFKYLEDTGYFMEVRRYNTLVAGEPAVWAYGSPKVNPDEKNWITILDVEGTEEYIKFYGKEDIRVIVLEVSDEERERRAKIRGSFDKTEWNRRLADDNVKFSREKIEKLKDLALNFELKVNE